MKDLVLKINDKCNFKCDFCSSNKIAENHEDLDIMKVKLYISKNVVNNIIVNGGDPLCVSPSYYEELIKMIKVFGFKTRISMTTNLWDFWLRPEKWEAIFKEDIVDICTSFQYGNSRKIATGEVYTEEKFRKVYNLFKERIGKDLPFIAVVTEDNEEYSMDTVYLAKELGTSCRLNGCLASGRASKMYPYYKMLKLYLDIIEKGLSEYEENTRIIQKVWREYELNECPYNTNCKATLACMSPSGVVHTCASIADDLYNKELSDHFLESNKRKIPFEMKMIKPACTHCTMSRFCNSCYKRVIDIKSDEEQMKKHCEEMKKLENRCLKVMGEPG